MCVCVCVQNSRPNLNFSIRSGVQSMEFILRLWTSNALFGVHLMDLHSLACVHCGGKKKHFPLAIDSFELTEDKSFFSFLYCLACC